MAAMIQRVFAGFVLCLVLLAGNGAVAADRAAVLTFLKVTGFDAALDSIGIGAENAPAILGQEPGEFGIVWQKMVAEVMDPQDIQDTAVSMLEQTLDPGLLDHAMAFYGSDLGQRLVAAENAAHLEKGEDGKDEAGAALVAALMRAGEAGRARLEYFQRMNDAIDSSDMALKAMQEIQIRFLMAAAAHGVIELRMDEADMRELFHRQEPQMRATMKASALVNAAYTYQAFSDDEVRRYTDALETADMQRVYELMNSVHYEIMASRFEMLAARMAGLRPSQEL